MIDITKTNISFTDDEKTPCQSCENDAETVITIATSKEVKEGRRTKVTTTKFNIFVCQACENKFHALVNVTDSAL